MGKAWTGGRRLVVNQLCASLSLFVNEGAEPQELQGPTQLTLQDSFWKSISTQAYQAESDKISLPLCVHK